MQANYIAQCIEEIKQELRIDNINVKCNAVAKLTYVSELITRINFRDKKFLLLLTAANVRLRYFLGRVQHH